MKSSEYVHNAVQDGSLDSAVFEEHYSIEWEDPIAKDIVKFCLIYSKLSFFRTRENNIIFNQSSNRGAFQ